MLLEKSIERKFADWCKRKGVLCIKFTPKGEKGWPDRICVLPNGQHIWLELKREGKKPSDLQYHRMAQLDKQKAVVRWADTFEQAVETLQTYDRSL